LAPISVRRARLLQGKIRRGDSQVISAALLLADLRGFTALVDRYPGTEVVGWLNQHLECIGDAVAERDGEVLKFLGDGILAVFPAAPSGAERACIEAVRAAIDARRRIASRMEALGKALAQLEQLTASFRVSTGSGLSRIKGLGWAEG